MTTQNINSTFQEKMIMKTNDHPNTISTFEEKIIMKTKLQWTPKHNFHFPRKKRIMKTNDQPNKIFIFQEKRNLKTNDQCPQMAAKNTIVNHIYIHNSQMVNIFRNQAKILPFLTFLYSIFFNFPPTSKSFEL